MIRVPIFTADGRTTVIELRRTPPGSAQPQSVFLLWQRGEQRTPLEDGPPARRRWKSKYVTSELLTDRELDRLAEHVAGWEHVLIDGEPIACSRSLLLLVLRVNFIRVQIERAITEARALGLIEFPHTNVVTTSEKIHELS